MLKAKTDEEIIKVAEGHSIDFVDKSIQEVLNKKRFEEIARRANKEGKGKKYTAEGLGKMYKEGKELMFGIHRNDDSPIGDITIYGIMQDISMICKRMDGTIGSFQVAGMN